jgi:NADPH-dependent curcumin reductase CurA
MINRRILLRAYPAAGDPPGPPDPADFELTTADVAEPAEGEALVRTHYLSMDPFVRMQLAARPVGPPPIPLGSLMPGRAVGRVVASRRADLPVGAWVAGDLGWQDYALVNGPAPALLDPALGPVSAALGLLGPSGATAYLCLTHTGGLRAGETVAITAAAGSVGSAACQIARHLGCRVIGIGQGDVQTAFILRLGADAAIDAGASDLAGALTAASPGGIDLALDTVGSGLHDALLGAMRPQGRVVMAGFISAYGAARPQYGNPTLTIFKRLTLRGFLLGDHAEKIADTKVLLADWLRSGKLQNVEHVTEGLENAPRAFAALFAPGTSPGKQLVRVAGAPPIPSQERP